VGLSAPATEHKYTTSAADAHLIKQINNAAPHTNNDLSLGARYFSFSGGASEREMAAKELSSASFFLILNEPLHK
jgi:hypothetical protein